MSGHHHHAPIRGVLILTVIFLLVEVAGGIAANSLALLSDAGHMFVDALALFIAMLAQAQGVRPRDARHTFGYRRLEIVAALVNGALLLWIAGAIAKEAWDRLHDASPVSGGLMLWVAGVGLLVNLVGLFLLRGHSKHDLNMRGAFLHLLGDTLSSVGTMVAAIVIRTTGWVQADSVASFLISLLILVGGTKLILESLHYLMEGAPPDIAPPEVESCLRACPEVVDVHDLHVWRISSGMDILTAHVVVRDAEQSRAVRSSLRETLRDRFGLHHTTLEVEGPEERDDPAHARGICLP